ncbi:ABC transporter substrate-binding protein [Nocardia sp. CDC160]|uniref:ABC transporter substrate-binding protein n=1 Tax=Nocardia sp. CDC160 TaxID=3112166 RepID=UPI002DBF9626|nr:ABC transporter substrate-binding protein [Nocardia sp. CDC160]MEC3914688.1 ABC transporter substrate-binding protein [Nocardia sp. CDC160]
MSSAVRATRFRFRPRRRHAAPAVLLIAALFATACGTTTTDPAPAALSQEPLTAAPTSYPLTIDNCGKQLTFDKPPSRVLITNGASVAEVESFIALGLQDRIVANSQSYGLSDEAGMAEKVAAVPTGGLTLNENMAVPREQILVQKPDLVVSTWYGEFDDKIGSIGRDALAASGIPGFVDPANCTLGNPAATADEKARAQRQTVDASFDLLLTLGRIFDVQQRAVDYVKQQRDRIAAIQRRVDGKPRPNVLLVYPGMTGMNSNGLPAVFGGGIYDDVINRAGGRNSFGGKSFEQLADVNAEALASTPVDLVVIGRYRADEDAAKEADALFAKFPQWAASKNKKFITLSDSPYVGPLNAIAIEKIADALHPGN